MENMMDPSAPSGDNAPQHVEVVGAPSSSDSHDADAKKEKPRDSKGWDGKLRLDRSTLTDGKVESDVEGESGEESEEGGGGEGEREGEGGGASASASAGPTRNKAEVVQGEAVEGEELAADEDLLDEYLDDEEEIDLVHQRVESMAALKLGRFGKLRVGFFSPSPFLSLFPPPLMIWLVFQMLTVT